MTNSPWNIDTLLALMNERDRRYADNRKCDQDAVLLAKVAADEAKGKVTFVALIAIVSLILTVMDKLR